MLVFNDVREQKTTFELAADKVPIWWLSHLIEQGILHETLLYYLSTHEPLLPRKLPMNDFPPEAPKVLAAEARMILGVLCARFSLIGSMLVWTVGAPDEDFEEIC